MAKRLRTQKQIMQEAIGLIDSRQTDNDGLLIKRDRKVTMLDVFGNEQKTAVAYYVSDQLAKGYNNHEILSLIKEKFNLTWTLFELNKVKMLLHKLWRCDIAHTMNEQIAQQLAEIRVQKKEAWAAWEKSKLDKKSVSKKKSISRSQAPEMTWDQDETVDNSEERTGDVKYLQLIADLCKEERKLLGLYAPEKKMDDNRPSAIQFNFVGKDANGGAADLMSTIMSMPLPIIPQAQQNVEDIEVTDVQEDDIESLAKEMMGM